MDRKMDRENKKYQLDTPENRQFLRELREDLIRFGRDFPSPGGASYYLGDDGTPWKDRPRETWITGRMAHVYSLATMLRENGESPGPGGPDADTCRHLAREALRGLQGELRDTEHGGWFAGITPAGEPLPGKQCYAHAFVILAASSARIAQIDGAGPLLEEALAVYDRYFWNDAEGLSADTWNTDFTELETYRGLNANMHTVEAFLAVWDALADPVYLKRAGRIIRSVIRWAQNNDWRIPEHFTRDWKPELGYHRERPEDPFKPYGATPGHGIEWARLMIQWSSAACREGSPEQAACTEAARQLYRRAVTDAWDRDGAPGLVYTTDWEGQPVVHDRMHWTLAEAINTSAVLYRSTGEPGYRQDYADYLAYLEKFVLDHQNGSWFHQLDRNNRLKGTVWPGKSDLYHAIQATLIPYAASNSVSIAAAVRFSGEKEA